MAADAAGADRPTRAGGVVERGLDGRLVLYHVGLQRVHVLNPTAAFLWRLCDGTRRPADLAAALAARFPADGEAIAADVATFLRALRVESLLAE